ncbi:hypothetical protein MRY82_02635 [bacterium]|nr:hypothetical protein [bacterium]
MKQFILAVLCMSSLGVVKAQSQTINAKYLAQFTCYEYMLDNFFTKDNFSLEECMEGFLLAYQNQDIEDELSNAQGPMLAKVIGFDLVSTLEDYNACLVKDYCSEKTKNSRERDPVFSSDALIQQCQLGFTFFKNLENQDYLGVKEAVISRNHFSSVSDSEKTAFSQGVWQAYKCN